ncbi:MAG: hypothetical protein V4488_04655 [Pseudomonadota bacterium]
MNTKFPAKRILCLLALSAAAVTTVGAHAQSQEYRRGYDQGYRDAMEAQSRGLRDGRDERSGQEGRIVIEEAVYGTREGRCNARNAVQRAAGSRRHMEIAASNALCGDPAPNRPKVLEVTYRCGDNPPERAVVPENEMLELSCR